MVGVSYSYRKDSESDGLQQIQDGEYYQSADQHFRQAHHPRRPPGEQHPEGKACAVKKKNCIFKLSTTFHPHIFPLSFSIYNMEIFFKKIKAPFTSL